MKKIIAICSSILLLISPLQSLGYVSLESVATNGTISNGSSDSLSMTPDGRYIVFTNTGDTLVPGDGDAFNDIFLRDTLSQITTKISIGTGGTGANNDSHNPDISDDGRYIVFQSAASDLVSGDTNGQTDIFLVDTLGGILSLISTDSSGAIANNVSTNPKISADGRYVVFQSSADNLVTGDVNLATDIFVKDTITNATSLVSSDSLGAFGGADSYSADINANATHVVFSSEAANLVPGDTNGVVDIFVKNITNGSIERVSVDFSGNEGDNVSTSASINKNGDIIAFRSLASNLDTGDTNGHYDIFVRNTTAGTTSRISLSYTGGNSDGPSSDPAIGLDGNLIVFSSQASNLVSGDTNGVADIFIKNIANDTMRRVNVDFYGNESTQYAEKPSIGNSGDYIAFLSAGDLGIVQDINGQPDVFQYRSSVNCRTVTDVTYDECVSLINLYQSTNGQGWLNQANWMGSGDASPDTVCDWFGVGCFGSGVRDISLQSNLLSGTLPASLTGLTNLENFTVSANYLNGVLPSEWSAWTKMQYFDIYNNNITGSLPSSWSTWTNMQYFYGYSNQLTGTLPSSWSTWTGMIEFNVGNNWLTGSLPSSWSTWTNVQQFFTHNNDINGLLPSSWSTWQGLTWLNVADNNLTGSLPSSWSSLTGLQTLWLSNNDINGAVPASWSGMTSATTIDFSGNALSGYIPASWIYLTNLQDNIGLVLDNNCLDPMLPEPPQSFVDLKAGVVWKTNQNACGAPATGALAAPTIISPTSGQVFSSSSVTLVGTGHPGATIHITLGSLVTTVADGAGQWSYPFVGLTNGSWQADVYQTATGYPTSSTNSVQFTVSSSTPPVYTPPQPAGFAGGGGGGGMAMAMALSALMNGGAPEGQTIILTPSTVTPGENGIVTNKWSVLVGEDGYKTYSSVDSSLAPIDIAYLIKALSEGSVETTDTLSAQYLKRVDIRRPSTPLVMSELY